jgi:hypothetical protein
MLVVGGFSLILMPDRDSLHQLVDTLPEAALEAVERALQRLQTWPPERPADAQKMQERAQAILAERTARTSGASGVGCGVGGSISGWSGGGHWTDDGDGVALASGFKGRDQVTIQLRRFRGHDLQIERQLGVSEDKRKVLYTLLIKGPDGKEGHAEIEFEIADDSPASW